MPLSLRSSRIPGKVLSVIALTSLHWSYLFINLSYQITNYSTIWLIPVSFLCRILTVTKCARVWKLQRVTLIGIALSEPVTLSGKKMGEGDWQWKGDRLGDWLVQLASWLPGKNTILCSHNEELISRVGLHHLHWVYCVQVWVIISQAICKLLSESFRKHWSLSFVSDQLNLKKSWRWGPSLGSVIKILLEMFVIHCSRRVV